MRRRYMAFALAATLLLGVFLGAALPRGSAAAGEPEAAPAADAAGTLSFENLEARLRGGNYALLALAENLARLDAMDRAKAYEDLSEANNALSDAIMLLYQYGQTDKAAEYREKQEALYEQLMDLKPEAYEKTYRESVRQIEAVVNQIIMGAQTLYLTTRALERNLEAGERGLAALDRTLAEMEVRYARGQVSELTLLTLRDARVQTASGLASLRVQIVNCKAQLQAMTGQTPTGELTLTPPAEVTDAARAEMDYAADLAAAKEASLDLYNARKKADEAKEDWDDAEDGYPTRMAKHAWQAAVYSAQAAEQDLELTFGKLSRAVDDKAQTLAAARAALALEERSLAAAEKRYELGMISRKARDDARDALETARETVASAQSELLSAYNTYRWAVRGLTA